MCVCTTSSQKKKEPISLRIRRLFSQGSCEETADGPDKQLFCFTLSQNKDIFINVKFRRTVIYGTP